jgi:hypothetical protein
MGYKIGIVTKKSAAKGKMCSNKNKGAASNDKK